MQVAGREDHQYAGDAASDDAELEEGTTDAPGFGAVNRDVTRFVTMIQSADIRPAKSIIGNIAPSCIALKNDLARWRKINQERLPALNVMLKQHNTSVPIVAVPIRECPNL